MSLLLPNIQSGDNVARKNNFLGERVVQYYLDKHISRASAALSYFFMLSLFPLLICLYAMLGSLFPSVQELKSILNGLLPEETLHTITEFLAYVDENSSTKMLTLAIAAMTGSSAAGFRIIDKVIFELKGQRREERFFAFIFSFVFSLIFLAALYLAAILMATGEWFISYVERYVDFLNISHNWSWFRFVILFLLLYVLILGVYRVCTRKNEDRILVPGAVFASVSIVGVSIVFSWFIGMSVKYSLVYGSLASVMIMLLWLYICGNILFVGSIINICLEK